MADRFDVVAVRIEDEGAVDVDDSQKLGARGLEVRAELGHRQLKDS
jgi:hypothetical protein